MGKRKQIIIHAGLHRCASTAIQDMLRANQQAIEAAGFALLTRPQLEGPLFGRQLRLLYRHAPGSWTAKARLALVRGGLDRIAADKILISEENLAGVMPGVLDNRFYPHWNAFLAAVKALSLDFDVRLKLVVRRQDRYLESAYAFRVVRGLRQSFPEFLASIGPEHISWLSLSRAIEAAGLADLTNMSPMESWPPDDPGMWAAHFLELGGIITPAHSRLGGNQRPAVKKLQALIGTQVTFTDEERAAFLAMHADDNVAFLNHPMVQAAPSVWGL